MSCVEIEVPKSIVKKNLRRGHRFLSAEKTSDQTSILAGDGKLFDPRFHSLSRARRCSRIHDVVTPLSN